MLRVAGWIAICGLVLSVCVCAQEEKGSKAAKVKTLPDRYAQFKLGVGMKVILKRATPIYTAEPSPNVTYMVMDIGSRDIDAVLLGFWKEKLSSITMIFQPQYTLDMVKPNLIKKYGAPAKEDPMETVWADSLHIMVVKHEYSIMDKPNRVTVTYADLAVFQEMQKQKGQGGGSGKGGKGGVPTK